MPALTLSQRPRNYSAERSLIGSLIIKAQEMIRDLREHLSKAIADSSPLDAGAVSELLESPKKRGFGDIAFPCFALAKLMKKSPADCAAELSKSLQLPSGFSRFEVLGPFINFHYDRSLIVGETLADLGVLPEQSATQKKSDNHSKTIIVEYSSPNIAKPFHVGHLRATLIGNCLDRCYRELGYNTISINHLGDWGTQFGFVWAGCQIWGTPEEPSVSSLVDLYRKATALRESQEEENPGKEVLAQPNVNEMARSFFIDLEDDKQYAKDFWQMCVDVSLVYLRATYDRLGVSFDHYTGESFYSDKLKAVEEELREAGLLLESKGALGVDLGEKLGFARIATPDGRSLYLTRDLATAKYRAETFNFDRAMYVVGAPQTLHFQQIKGVLSALNKAYADRIEHVAFGHVLGMKTRGGGAFIELNSFLDEAVERATEAYREQVSKRPEGLDETEVARAVSLSAILFGTLARTNGKDVHFDWKHALEFQGDSGPYLLYAYARINGIKSKAIAAGIDPSHPFSPELLTEDSAYALCSVLSNFEETLEKTVADNEPSYLCAYALELAKAFSKAYLELKVLDAEAEVASARLALFEATRLVLKKSLMLLGIETIERM